MGCAAVLEASSIEKCQTDNNNADEAAPPYIEILRGRDGGDGEPGPRGLPGRDGKVGAKGEKSEKGDTREQGPPGPSSGGVTSVR